MRSHRRSHDRVRRTGHLAQIARNWLVLHGIGVHVSLFDAIALLIAMFTLGQLPIGPTLGPAAAVLILGSHGVATVAAAGVLLTATATVGSLATPRGRSPTTLVAAAPPSAPSPPKAPSRRHGDPGVSGGPSASGPGTPNALALIEEPPPMRRAVRASLQRWRRLSCGRGDRRRAVCLWPSAAERVAKRPTDVRHPPCGELSHPTPEGRARQRVHVVESSRHSR